MSQAPGNWRGGSVLPLRRGRLPVLSAALVPAQAAQADDQHRHQNDRRDAVGRPHIGGVAAHRKRTQPWFRQMILRPTLGRTIPTAVLPASPRTSQSSHHNAPNKGQVARSVYSIFGPACRWGTLIATPCRMLLSAPYALARLCEYLHTTTRPSAANTTARRVVNGEAPSWKTLEGAWRMISRPLPAVCASEKAVEAPRRPFPAVSKGTPYAFRAPGNPEDQDHRHHRRVPAASASSQRRWQRTTARGLSGGPRRNKRPE